MMFLPVQEGMRDSIPKPINFGEGRYSDSQRSTSQHVRRIVNPQVDSGGTLC